MDINKIKIQFLVVALLTPLLTFAYGPYDSLLIVEVKDGDTVEVIVEVYPSTFIRTDVRVRGIDSPETRRGMKSGHRIPECELVLGRQAKNYAAKILHSGEGILLVDISPKDTKYAGRISGDFIVGTSRFSNLMVEAGHAIRYAGGARQVWPCDSL